jgi:hypothetical protein
MEIKAKGIEHPITLYEVLGIGGAHKLLLPETVETLVPLAKEIPLRYEVLEASHLNGAVFEGRFTKLSAKAAEAHLSNPVPPLSNLRMYLVGADGQQIPGSLYGKVMGAAPGASTDFSVRFTSIPPEIEAFLRLQTVTPQ